MDREPTQYRTQVVAGVGEKVVPRRDQLVGETTFAQQILVGGFALDLEKVVHIASSRIALELEQSIGASALPTACAVLLSSLKLGTRSGVLKQARIDAD